MLPPNPKTPSPIALLFICVYLCSSAVAVSSCAPAHTAQESEERYTRQREEMVRTQIAASRGLGADAVRDRRVLDAMRRVPRHRFIPAELRDYAYADTPLPIGLDQTISQPYMVAKMTELAAPRPEHRALEIGTGSGYQAAVLSLVVKQVYTIELLEPLGAQARERLRALGYKNVEVRVGDGYAGWPEHAPFDIVLVTAAPPELPMALIEQLKPGGRMVIPTGRLPDGQWLRVITKGDKGPRDYRVRDVMPVRFVPMIPGKKN
ncbi:MAG TPA: protein-L-isoaspartate(D-aspartate) O-methyltransferase [Candidatus Acidoferrales bacterium]